MSVVIKTVLWITYILSLYFSVFLVLVYIEKKHLLSSKAQTPLSDKTPAVTVIIPAYNEEKTIQKTLQSVDNLDYPKEKLQVIVVNDGSSDKTQEKIEQFIANKAHFMLLSHKNKGKAVSLNRALKYTKGEYFACLDADSFVDKATLRKMLTVYEKSNDERLAIVTPAMKVEKPKTVLEKIQWLEYLVIILFARLTSQLDCLYVAPGPFSLYKTKIITDVGGFDEKNIVEDQEIAYRMQLHHYKIKQCFDGYVYTAAPKKLKPFYKQRRRWYLGGVLCLYQYKKMIGNKQYGDFGVMQTLKSAVGFLLAITGIGLTVYIVGEPVVRLLRNLYLINFNVTPFFSSFNLKTHATKLLTIDIKLLTIVICLFFIGIFFFYQAHKNAKEKINKVGWIPILPYFLFYYILKGGILLYSVAEYSWKKKIKW